jgi:DNA (cytosine-5)-methyltransferase 1
MTTPTFVDLFAGAGGLSLGLSSAKWTELLAVEYWADAAKTFAHNFGTDRVWKVDVRDVTTKTLAAHLQDRPTWIVGGPPCQGYSTVGKRDRTDDRNQLFLEFKRLVQVVEPEGFVIENVLGLRDMRFTTAVKEAFTELGYSVSAMVLRAADHGVPQLRRRVVFVGSRVRGYFQGVPASHQEPDYVSVWDAISDLPPLNPGETATEYSADARTTYQKLMRTQSSGLQGHTASRHPPHLVRAISYIPDGGNRRDIPDEYQPTSGFHNSYSRLNSKAPAVAVTSNMSKPSATRCIHPFQHRGLTAREGARLQSFPDGFHFLGGNVSQRLQIANAVPPLLGTSLGLALEDPANWSDLEAVGDHRVVRWSGRVA